MATYGDRTRIKERSGVTASDVAVTDRDTDADTDEDDLDLLIDELNEIASETVEDYCDRDFTKTSETVKLDGNGRKSMRLPGYPVISIDTLKIDDETIDASDYRVRDNPARDKDRNGGILEMKERTLPDLWEVVEITYTWGFETAPGSVREVVEQLVIDALRSAAGNEKGSKAGAQSYSMDGFSVTFDQDLQATVGTLSEEQKKQLNEYRRVVAV